MIKRVIALFSAICLTAALAGCSSEEKTQTGKDVEAPTSQTNEAQTSKTEEAPLVIEGNEYECGDFKFTIRDIYEEDYASDDKTSYSFNKPSSMNETKIKIDSTALYFADLKTHIDDIAENWKIQSYGNDIEITAVETDTDLDCEYSAGAVHLELSNDKGISKYFIENETRGLEIEARYKLSSKKSVRRDMDALVASAEYISDYTFSMEDTVIDNEYLSVNVPKEWRFTDSTEGYKSAYQIEFGKTQAETAEEGYTTVSIRIYENREKSPAELADGIAENHADSDEKVSRFKYEIFGIESECAEIASPTDTARMCYIENDGLYYSVILFYLNDGELADIEDLLNRIELK